jgi:hypothetical protein
MLSDKDRSLRQLLQVPNGSQFATDGSSRHPRSRQPADRRLIILLPPMLPLSAVPITSQQDPIRQRPDIPPVVPVQESSNESTIDLQQRDPEEAAFQLREEQRRKQEQQRRRREADEDPEEHLAIPGDELNADNTVPVAPLMEDQPRQGLWVDIQI